MSDATNNKSFGSGLPSINEECKCIFYMTYDIILFFYLWLYGITYDVKIPYPGKFPYLRRFPYTGFLHEVIHIFIPGLSYPENFTYPGKYPYRVIYLYPVKASISKSVW